MISHLFDLFCKWLGALARFRRDRRVDVARGRLVGNSGWFMDPVAEYPFGIVCYFPVVYVRFPELWSLGLVSRVFSCGLFNRMFRPAQGSRKIRYYYKLASTIFLPKRVAEGFLLSASVHKTRAPNFHSKQVETSCSCLQWRTARRILKAGGCRVSRGGRVGRARMGAKWRPQA